MSTPDDMVGAVAIVGMAGRFPGAANLARFWQNLCDGVDSVRDFSDEELLALGLPESLVGHPGYVKVAAQPPGIELFDAPFFGFSHREAEILDPQQRLFLETSWHALEDAGYDPEGAGGAVVGVFGGATISTYLLFNLMPDTALRDAIDPLQLLVGNAPDSLATRVSYKLNLKGPSTTVQSACSTSLVAVHLACQSLLAGECDLALAGGSSVNVSLLAGYLRKEGSVFSSSGRCRAFDAGAEGILFGGGVGVAVLKRLEDALADGDPIRAVVRGSAMNNDGAMKVGYTAPSVDGQAEVITEALAASGVPAETLSYIEAHGTGTRLGDPIEIQALTKAFRSETERRGFIPLGSVKTNVGHLDTAAGIAGLMKTVLALEHGQIPPSLHFSEPNPEIDFAASPVYVNTRLLDWQPAPGAPRRAGVSSFGFGGTNIHLIVEEAPARPVASTSRSWHALPLSAKDGEALERMAAELADHLESHPELPLADVAHTLQSGRGTFAVRRAVLGRDREEVLVALRRGDPEGKATAAPDRPALAFAPPAEVGEVGELAARWLVGESRDWSAAYEGEKRRRVSLPGYPFAGTRYWIEAPGIVLPGAPQAAVAVAAPAAGSPAVAVSGADPMIAVAAGAAQTLHPRPKLFTPYQEPGNDYEQKVVAIWQEVLGVSPVGVHDNFFQLGGHSLLATQILARFSDVFAVSFPLQHLFSFPTAAELAEALRFLVEEEGGGAAPAAEAAPIELPPVTASPLRGSGEPLPLSFQQERLWFLNQLDRATGSLTIPAAVRFHGRLDVAVLAASLDAVVVRHESLRTRFPTRDDGGAQEILPALAVALPVVDLSGLPAGPRAAAERGLSLAHANRTFDLETGPLVAALLLRLAEGEHLLALVVHHMVSDGWSLGVIQKDLARFYRAGVTGGAAGLPALPFQYADYADWQRRVFTGEVLERELAYWRPKLAGVPFLDLRGDRPRPPVQTFRGAYVDFELPPGLAFSLSALAEKEGVTLFMALLAGFSLFLSRYSQQEDFAVGALTANRGGAGLEGMVGFFVNNLALRTDLGDAPTVAEFLGRIRETALGAFAHQELPFEKLLEELKPERDLSRGALVQVMFNLLNFPVVREELPGLTLESAGVRSERANFDLTLWMTEGTNGWVGWLEYNADLFDAGTVRRMAGHLLGFFGEIAAAPERRLSEIPWLSEEERRQLEVWNQSGRPRVEGETFLDLLARQAARAPGATAAICSGRSLTYAELAERSDRAAGRLAALGVGPESVVPVLAERGLDFLVALLGVLKAGGAYLPLDPAQPLPRTAAIVERSGATLALTGGDYGERLAAAWQGGSLPRLVGIDAGFAAAPEVTALRPLPQNLAYVIYTSGSTGAPKGALLDHAGMLNHLLAKVEDLELTPADVVAQNASQAFDISVWQLFSALAVGGTVAIYPDAVAHDPAALLAAVAADGVTILEVVPSLLAAALDPGEGGHLPELPALRYLIPTGEALPPELARRWLAHYPGIPLVNAYGPTECSDDVSHHFVREPPAEGVGQVPIGRPVANMTLHVVDRALTPVPPGVPGELLVGGIGVGRGYLGEPGRTAQVFVPDPVTGTPGGRLYRTGDLVRQNAAADLEFLGRLDFQVKVRGFRIELGEIEAALDNHPGVQQAVVLALPTETGDKRLAAYVVAAHGGEAPSAAGLRAYLRERLIEAMVPSAFVFLGEMPVNTSGKVDRRALPAPDWSRADGEEGFVAPRTPAEELLADIWLGLLKVERVGAFDSFFDLGGHSLLATQVVAKIRQTFEVEVPVRALFEAPTLAELALVIEEELIARIDALSEEEIEELA